MPRLAAERDWGTRGPFAEMCRYAKPVTATHDLMCEETRYREYGERRMVVGGQLLPEETSRRRGKAETRQLRNVLFKQADEREPKNGIQCNKCNSF